MKRGHTVERYIKTVERIGGSPRDIALTTDIIVGFPGETEADFKETVRLVERCGYDSAYLFKYSPRPGTPAYQMPDDVSAAEKTLRFLELERVQKRVQAKRLERYLGKKVKVLVEGRSTRTPGGLTGHSTCHKIVNFIGDDHDLGRVVDVRITEVKSNSLFGTIA